MLRVMYLHHCGALGGASRSLFEVVEQLKEKHVQPFLIAPKGEVAEYADSIGVKTITTRRLFQFSNSEFGSYKGKRWLLLLREIAALPSTIRALYRAKREWGQEIDVIHANEHDLIFSGVFAKKVFNKPLVLHVRSRQDVKNKWRRHLVSFFVKKYADKVIAIDHSVSSTIDKSIDVDVIFNGQKIPRSQSNLTQKRRQGSVNFGIVANFIPYKGVYDFVEAANNVVNAKKIHDVRFTFYGDNYHKYSKILSSIYKLTGFQKDVKSDLISYVERNKLNDYIYFRGFVHNTQDIFQDIDVLCFPSHLDAVGRPVFEAAFFEKPSIVSLRSNFQNDYIEHGLTGLIVPEKDPAALADSIEYFFNHPEKVISMGVAARNLALEKFDIKNNAVQLLNVYKSFF